MARMLLLVATARARGSITATRRGGPGASTGRTSSATSSITSCSTRATGARCWRRRRPATSGRPSSAPPISAAPGRKPRGRRRSRRPPDGEDGRAVDHTFWLTPGHAERAGRLVRRHLAAGPVPLRRTAASRWEPFSGINDDPQYREVDGHRAGRHAGRAEAALDHRRSARSRAPVLRHVGRRRARVGRRRPDLGAARRRARGGRGLRPRPTSPSTTRTASGSARATPTASTSRTTAASTGSTGRRTSGCASARTCRSGSATSASRWSCTRATRTPRGCSRWTARRCGRARARTASPRSTSRATAARRWQRLDAGLPETPGLVDGEAPGDDGGRARSGGPLLRHDQRRAVGEPRRRPALGLHRAAPARDLRGGSGRAGVSAAIR